MLKLTLALVAVMMAAYIGVTEVRKFRHRTQRDRFVTEVRALAEVFENYHAQKGGWPPATHAEARMPKGMEGALSGTRWEQGPPFGGNYDWIPPAPAPADAKDDAEKKPAPSGWIAVTAFAPTPALPLSHADLLAIDRQLDDGNLATGRFRTGFNGWPVYQVNPSR